jgi:SPP1 family predicted phage head-tail adaptor
MRAGHLRHRVALESNTRSRSSTGEYTDSWTTTATVNANVSGDSGRTMDRPLENLAENTIRVTIRYRSDVAPTMRVSYADPKTSATRYWYIEAILNDDETRRWQTLVCREVNSGQQRAQ